MAKIILENLTKRFGALEAVKNLSLEVEDGSFTCLLGPSGCGKTTTLRMIAGLETPDEGDIYIDDTLVNDLSPVERDVAMVFQFYAIYPGMSVEDNLAFPLKQRKMPRDEIRRKVKETAEKLRIDDVLHEDAMSLTEGEKQRVALGRAFVRRPNVFLLDEPLSNLDARLRAGLRVELKRLQRDVGQTTIYVTHDQIEAMTMADKVGVMDLGVLQQYDAPDNLYDHPKNLFVAGFVGSPTMNFMDCSFSERDEKAFLEFGTFTLDVSELKELIKKQATSSELVFGIRPSHVSVGKETIRGEGFRGEVYVVELIGDKTIVDLRVGERLLKAVASRALRVARGEKLWITFNRDKMHLFDKKTGKAIL